MRTNLRLLLAASLLLASAGGCQKIKSLLGKGDKGEAAKGDSIGIAECDEYLTKVEACLSKAPADMKATMELGMKSTREGWKQLLAAGNKDVLKEACVGMLPSLASMPGCGSGAAAAGAPKVEPAAAAAAPAKADSNAAAGAKGDSIGIPECDEYLTKMEACMSKAPAEAKAALEAGMKTTRDGWKQLLAAGNKDVLKQACAGVLPSLASMPGCGGGAAAAADPNAAAPAAAADPNAKAADPNAAAPAAAADPNAAAPAAADPNAKAAADPNAAAPAAPDPAPAAADPAPAPPAPAAAGAEPAPAPAAAGATMTDPEILEVEKQVRAAYEARRNGDVVRLALTIAKFRPVFAWRHITVAQCRMKSGQARRSFATYSRVVGRGGDAKRADVRTLCANAGVPLL